MEQKGNVEEGACSLTVVKHPGAKHKVKKHNEKKKGKKHQQNNNNKINKLINNQKKKVSFFRVLNSVLSLPMRYP